MYQALLERISQAGKYLGKCSRKRKVKYEIPNVGESTLPDGRRATCPRRWEPEAARGDRAKR